MMDLVDMNLQPGVILEWYDGPVIVTFQGDKHLIAMADVPSVDSYIAAEITQEQYDICTENAWLSEANDTSNAMLSILKSAFTSAEHVYLVKTDKFGCDVLEVYQCPPYLFKDDIQHLCS